MQEHDEVREYIELDNEQGQEGGNEEFVTLSIIPNFDGIPTSMIESSILDFNEAMEQITQEQHVVNLPTFAVMTETPPLGEHNCHFCNNNFCYYINVTSRYNNWDS